MIKNIKKLKFLDFLANTKCNVILYQEGLSEEGEPLEVININSKCIYQEKTKRIITPEGKQITLNGFILIKGDIAPTLNTIADGEVIVNERKYNIHSGYRVLNPDSSVNHTKLELL